ncbi:MAG: FliM/FliN family flagellar motor switch protein [Deltaproteobacteria bacterium]|nr:FliM/FliN family flagellar motor switch protein [Deltaproteobacteria bacterium]
MDDLDNPLDDELLKELGLEPKIKSPPPPPPKPPAPKAPMASPPKAQVPPVAAKSPPAEAHFSEGVKNLSKDMPLQVVAVLGKKTMSLAEVVALKQGELVEFQKLPQEPIDLVANGKLVARGELVLVEGKLGIQIKQLMG